METASKQMRGWPGRGKSRVQSKESTGAWHHHPPPPHAADQAPGTTERGLVIKGHLV